jgi:hypothetical protein
MQPQQQLTEALGLVDDTDPHAFQASVLEGFSSVSKTLRWTGGTSPVGTYKLQATDVVDGPVDADWADLTPTMDIVGDSGVTALYISPAPAYRVRGVVTLASGEAEFTEHTTLKEF